MSEKHLDKLEFRFTSKNKLQVTLLRWMPKSQAYIKDGGLTLKICLFHVISTPFYGIKKASYEVAMGGEVIAIDIDDSSINFTRFIKRGSLLDYKEHLSTNRTQWLEFVDVVSDSIRSNLLVS